MKLLDGPLAGTDFTDGSDLVVRVAFPTMVTCDHLCLGTHIRTDEYWLKGPNAGRWYRSFTSLDLSDKPEALAL